MMLSLVWMRTWCPQCDELHYLRPQTTSIIVKKYYNSFTGYYLPGHVFMHCCATLVGIFGLNAGSASYTWLETTKLSGFQNMRVIIWLPPFGMVKIRLDSPQVTMIPLKTSSTSSGAAACCSVCVCACVSEHEVCIPLEFAFICRLGVEEKH